jgi:2-oxoisovalerate dehydrogenase E1 component
MLTTDLLLNAYRIMVTARSMAAIYDDNRTITKYVHSTSAGHEAIQIAAGLQLTPNDWFSSYYRDDSLMMAAGFKPQQLMLQLLAKATDPFSGGRFYYCHPSSRDADKPKIMHQSSATGMQDIPATGIAQALQYQLQQGLLPNGLNPLPVVLCSLGDGSVTDGEVSEAWQFAILKLLPIIYLVQDNGWSISATTAEVRVMNAFENADGFIGLYKLQCNGAHFDESYQTLQQAFAYARTVRNPVLVHATVPLLGHHTSGVQREFYRSKADLQQHSLHDPIPHLRQTLLQAGIAETVLLETEATARQTAATAFQKAVEAPDPNPATVTEHIFAPTPITEEKGERSPKNAEKVLMVDAALHAIEEILAAHPETLLYGQDVGRRLGGVFREAATLAEKFVDHRVFNTAIQEAYIVGSTAGISAAGLKPIVEDQFADYIYPGFNQLVTEISKSCYLSNGKFPVQMVSRIPTGAYGGGGPYHSGSIESTLLSIKGIKVVYPSNAADMKGLMKAAFYDPNPVIMLEHKGLYWSKVPGTDGAKMPEPAADYKLPLGTAARVLEASAQHIKQGTSICIITYGMGVYWAKQAAQSFAGQVEIIDLRTLFPLDETCIAETVTRHGKVLVLTEEQQNNSFAEALAYRITHCCYQFLYAPIEVMGALNTPAVPIHLALEAAMLPSITAIEKRIAKLLAY